ncbi:MAG: hypothetical protein NTZ80_01380 [Patescibacteria group bacterium]|nr:hypothetical protein [Patescibacteria group bacterium]
MKLILQKIGLSQKEIEIFLSLFPLGPQPVSIIARHTDIPRPTVYVILDRLKKIGLVQELKRNDSTRFRCIPADEIPDIISGRISELEQTKKAIEEYLPRLKILEQKLTTTPTVRFHEGRDVVMQAYERITAEKEICAFFNPLHVKKYMPIYLEKVAAEIRRNNGKARELLTECDEAQEYKKKWSSEQHQIKILPKRAQFTSDTIICADRIYMIAYDRDQITATEIISPALVKTQQAVFEEMWNK